MAKHVAVLMGGWSAEREVSPALGHGLRRGAGEQGLPRHPDRCRARHRDGAADAEARRRRSTLLHGPPGEDGTLQGILEIIGIPYTPFGRARLGARDAEGPRQDRDAGRRHSGAGRHGRVAPRGREGARAGARPMCSSRSTRARASASSSSPRTHEHPPQELTRADWAFGDDAAGRAVHPRQGADLRGDGRQGARRDRDRADRALLRLRGEIRTGRLHTPAAGANFTKCLPRGPKTGARGASRARLPGREPRGFPLRRHAEGIGGLVCLEVNTQPGMTETSLVPEMAAHAGIPFR